LFKKDYQCMKENYAIENPHNTYNDSTYVTSAGLSQETIFHNLLRLTSKLRNVAHYICSAWKRAEATPKAVLNARSSPCGPSGFGPTSGLTLRQ